MVLVSGFIVDARGLSGATLSEASVTRVAPAPFERLRLTPQDVTEPAKLLELLERMLLVIDGLSRAAFGSPLETWIEYRDLAVSSAAPVVLRHGLNRRVRWLVTRQSGAVSMTYNTASDDNSLVLTASATSTVSVMVF